MVQPSIDIWVTSNVPIMISPLGSSYVSEKQITLKELDQIQQIYKNHCADQYMLIPESIDRLGIKIDSSTVQAYTSPTFSDISSFIRCVLPQVKQQICNNITR